MSVGKISEFDVKSGNWSLYVERLEMYFKVNKVEKELWLPTLITGMGDEAYELLSNLSSPITPANMTYDAAVVALRNHLQPKPSIMAERFRFRQRRQRSEESIAQYITDLKKLSKYCDFGSNLEDNLRDQLVCGVQSDLIRQRLFAEDDLKYSGAVKLACALEAAERNAADVEPVAAGTSAARAVHAVHATHAAHAARGRGQRSRPPGTRKANGGVGNCTVCGVPGHTNEECRYKQFVCSKCKRSGHLRRVCPQWAQNARGGQRRGMNHVEVPQGEEAYEDLSSDEMEQLHQLSLNGYKPVSLPLVIDGVVIKMEVDTGSAVSCISKTTYNKHFKSRPIENYDLIFKFYDGSSIKPLGVIRPKVRYANKVKKLELFVIDGGTTSLLGRQWLSELGMEIPSFHSSINYNANSKLTNTNLNILMDRYKELFSGGLGRFTGGMARLRVREGAAPVFCRARPLPYALKGQVDAELDAMLRDGVIEPVESSDWATPLVPVRKADGGLRICADYKITLNPVLLIDRYPLPKIDDLLVSLNGAQLYSKIDLSQAYNQIELDESKELTVINTHRGLFKYNRLVFGLSSSPGIFQRIMINVLSGIPGVEVFLDDVIIGTKGGKSEHLATLETVLHRLQSHGMKLKKSKCLFLAEEVRYVGYIISKDGIKVDPEKVSAIDGIPRPRDVSELRSFLGLVNFYAKFVKNLSTTLAPLYDLLKKGISWKWSKSCDNAFMTIKRILTGAEVLVHYDQNKPLVLTCDASARGIGGVLTQEGADGAERPVVYVSRALTEAEKHYSQIDREALAIVFCLQKLHQYLYGRRFTLRTDHKPLVSIFGPKHGIPAMAASRMQRWAIILSAYTYDIVYVNTKDNGADGLSRLPVSSTVSDLSLELPEQTYLHFAQSELLLDHETVKRQTLRDPILGRILIFIRDGWPEKNDIRELQPYFNRRKELYEELGCVMWGHRVVIPQSCRIKVLEELHESHMGIVKTKAMARSYVWWAGIDEAVEALCRQCAVCAGEADAPPRHALAPWPWPARPWSRVHLDFLGPIFGKIYLVLIDARTKWIEVFPVPSTAANHTLEKLSEVFARWGLPKQIVSDNGPPFTSKEMSYFLSKNGIEHIFSAPYHPASNGAAENAVRSVKRVIKKAVRQGENIHTFLNTFLLHYRNTEHCTTGESPASLMLGRRLRTKLDALRPDREKKVREAQERQKELGTKVERVLQPGEEVWLRQYQGGDKWVTGKVTKKLGPTDYRILDAVGRESHRHIDQLRRRTRSSLVTPSGQTYRSSSDPEPTVDGQISDKIETPAIHPPSLESDELVDTGGASIPSRATLSPMPSAPVAESPVYATPPQTRPIRTCRLLNPPSYKY